MNNSALLEALDSVTTIPPIVYRDGRIDYDAQLKNMSYLMNRNFLSDGRERVISLAGTSLINHVGLGDQLKLVEETGNLMNNNGILMSAIVPNPIGEVGDLIEKQAALPRPPDLYLIMPLGGIYSTEGFYEGLLEFANQYGESCGARFLYYYRNERDRDQIVRLIKDSPHIIGVKVGTCEKDVHSMVEDVAGDGIVIWGVGDRSTKGVQLGTKGHTSGISILCARAGDEINNAQRIKDYDTAFAIEEKVTAFEEIRFENGRAYNYSAVIEAMKLSGFNDIDPGEGGPFNPFPPADVSKRIATAIEGLLESH